MRRSSRVLMTAALAVTALSPVVLPAAATASTTAVAVAASPATTAVPARRTPEQRTFIRALRRMVVATAISKVGAPYVWGESGPSAFDCSGLVMWTYQTTVNASLPHYSGAQMDVARPVTGKLRKGDLLFYGTDGSQHVSLYIGRGQMVGANNPRTGVVIDDIDSSYWSQRYAGAGRILY